MAMCVPYSSIHDYHLQNFKQNKYCQILLVIGELSDIREALCQMFVNKQDEKFLYFINNIDMAASDCVSVFRTMLWVVYDMWWFIWNNQVLERYLGQNILLNWNVCGFFPFPSATWNGKPVWSRPRSGFLLSSYVYQL